MIVTIHQPEHMPWAGFFHKMAMADLYVLLDHVQYRKGYFQNRNRLVDSKGEVFWCTVPLKAGSHGERICEKKVGDGNWEKKYLNKITESYRKCAYFDRYFDDFAAILNKNHHKLSDLNFDLICWFRTQLDINVEMILSSSLVTHEAKSDLNLDICSQLNASAYIAGPSGKDYLDLSTFKKRGIEVHFHQFSPPTYNAKHFIPGLSTLDLLMNHGPLSREIIGL
jgi:hypothetical protein